MTSSAGACSNARLLLHLLRWGRGVGAGKGATPAAGSDATGAGGATGTGETRSPTRCEPVGGSLVWELHLRRQVAEFVFVVPERIPACRLFEEQSEQPSSVPASRLGLVWESTSQPRSQHEPNRQHHGHGLKDGVTISNGWEACRCFRSPICDVLLAVAPKMLISTRYGAVSWQP